MGEQCYVCMYFRALFDEDKFITIMQSADCRIGKLLYNMFLTLMTIYISDL